MGTLKKFAFVFIFSYSFLFAQSEDPDRLKNFELMEKFSIASTPRGEHYGVSVFAGLFSGAAFGAGGGLVVYSHANKRKSLDAIYISSGVLALTGGIVGVVLAGLEQKKEKPYLYGKPLFVASWIGSLTGAGLGALGGLIPYSKNKNTDYILRGVGIGSLIGLTAGIIGYLVAPSLQKKIKDKEEKVSLSFISGANLQESLYQLEVTRKF